MTKQCQSIGKVGRIRNLVKLILSRRVLKEETVGARTTGRGRAFQTGTIRQLKKFFETSYLAKGRLIRKG